MAASWLSHRGGGVAAVVEALSRNVAEKGIDVRAFGLEENDVSDTADEWEGAPADRFRVLGPRLLGYSSTMSKAIIQWAPDLAHIHGLWTHPSRSVLQWSRATYKPYVVSPHGMLAAEALKFSPRKKRIVRWLFQDAVLSGAGMLHATSEQEVEEIRVFGLSQPVALIPNGIDIPEAPQKNELLRKSPFVLSLGRIHPKKALDRLIRAWALVSIKFPEWRLKIVGPSEIGYADELKQLAKTMNLDSVEISGPVFGEDKIKLLVDAEIFALSTLNENFALTVTESLSVGTPVISTKGAPWRGLIEERCGWWIDHGHEAMAAALGEAMSLSPKARRMMGARGRSWMVRDFSWDTIATQMAEAYYWLARGGSRPLFIHTE